MKVKICGITNFEDALLAERCGADALGFIFYKQSKRYIEPDAAAAIVNMLSPFTLKVGVFVNESADTVNETAGKVKLNYVQLHGEETPEYIKTINYPVIKSFRIHNEFEYSLVDSYSGVSFLFDSFSALEYGGTGKKFNWNLIPQNLKSRIILAGGISADNIDEIISNIKPAAIDVSSSLEEAPGKKDEQKLIQFFHKINSNRS